MKAYEGVDVYIHIFLTSEVEVSGQLSHPGHFTRQETIPLVPIGYEAGWAPKPVWTT
jgi:hypothetical protein